MRRLRETKGFTLIELVIIILVLGLLAVTAIPKFADLQAEAKRAAEKGVVGGVRGGIAIQYASNLLGGTTSWPANLDGIAGAATASAANVFFSNVLSPGVEDPTWSKNNGSVYTGPYGGVYSYNSTDGTFN